MSGRSAFLLISSICLLTTYTSACDKTCQKCPAVQIILKENLMPMPSVLLVLIMGYVEHVKEMPLFHKVQEMAIKKEPRAYALFCEDSVGPSIGSIKKAIGFQCGSRLELYRCMFAGGRLIIPTSDDSLRVDAQYTWYYNVVMPKVSLLLNRLSLRVSMR
jgi:hypothetical protein